LVHFFVYRHQAISRHYVVRTAYAFMRTADQFPTDVDASLEIEIVKSWRA
jgi:hypothetical protein